MNLKDQSINLIRDTLSHFPPLLLREKKRQLNHEKKPFKKNFSPPLPPVKIAPVKVQPKPPLKKEPEPQKKPVQAKPKASFKLEHIEKVTINQSLVAKKHLLQLDPKLPLVDLIPDDTKAKERQKRGVCLYQVAILVFENNPKKLLFLKNVERVLTQKHFPAKLYNALSIEKENGWESFLSSKSLKLIICSDHEIFHAKNLMKLYKEIPSQSKRQIQEIDLFLLPDISLYFKQPILKRALYKALCHKIQTL